MLNRLLATTALSLAVPLSFATEIYHPSNAEEGAMLRTDHMGGGPSRDQIDGELLAAQRNGSLSWISRGYPAGYPLVRSAPLTKTSDEVRSELQQWKRRPVTGGGLTLLPGELGWVDADYAR